MVHKKFILVITACLLFTCGSICIADTDSDKTAQKIIHSVMSPFCPGRLLSDCPSAQAHQLREKIQEDLKAGKSEATVLDSLYAIYGETVRSAPAFSGFGITAWITPIIALIIGSILLWFWLKLKIAEPDTAAPELSSEEQALAEKLKNL